MKTLKKTECRTVGTALAADMVLCVALSPIFADDSDTDDIPAMGSDSKSGNTDSMFIPVAVDALSHGSSVT